eukprot:NODE_6694_length_1647_cov_27.126974.p1 GENE.NODE_6694_length_1647_cov_27.126974~~NODE_6694_length_1647_cov_27.126974.p1  ORF type:complete len:247 (-),score=28.47 NODE_6694_length_1647_cov_27.126974:197-937(-)
MGLSAVLLALRARLNKDSSPPSDRECSAIFDMVRLLSNKFSGVLAEEHRESTTNDERQNGNWTQYDLAPFIVHGLQRRGSACFIREAVALATRVHYMLGIEALEPVFSCLHQSKKAWLLNHMCTPPMVQGADSESKARLLQREHRWARVRRNAARACHEGASRTHAPKVHMLLESRQTYASAVEPLRPGNFNVCTAAENAAKSKPTSTSNCDDEDPSIILVEEYGNSKNASSVIMTRASQSDPDLS